MHFPLREQGLCVKVKRMEPYIYALSANISFALGSVFFAHYSRRFSSLWMNCVKASVGLFCFFVVVVLTSGFHSISLLNFAIFFISGFLALGIGDLFLLQAFKQLGAGRTMVLFGFQPLIIGGLSFLFFDQIISGERLYAVIFLILCLLTFSYEIRKRTGKWDVSSLSIAFIAIFIDAIGVIITRYAFNMNDSITAFEGNFYRCFGAVIAYVFISFFKPIKLFETFKILPHKTIGYVLLGAFLGTFLSLAFYLQAIKTGHLASISAISITAVMFASFFESIWEKQMPSKFLFLAFGFFGIGMWILLT